MAKPTTQRWSKFGIFIGDGASPEDFTTVTCGLTSKGIEFSTETGDVTVPDCDDPDAPSWTERVPRAFSATVSGSGIMAEETFSIWNAWFLSGLAKNVRIPLTLTTPGYYEGSFIITAFGLPANEGDGKIGLSITLTSDGEVEWQTGSP